MEDFPAVNWIPGTLRLYESRASFWSSFFELNVLGAKRAGLFFGFAVVEDNYLTAVDVGKISEILREPTVVLDTVFHPRTDFSGCGSYQFRSERRPAESLRYCDECIKMGYHSNLHELDWLSCCPFHLVALRGSPTKECSRGRMASYVTAMQDLMTEHCEYWPLTKRFSPDFWRMGCFNELMNWIEGVNRSAGNLSTNEIWRSDAGDINSSRRALGRLHGIEPIPKSARQIFKNFSEHWSVRFFDFPADARENLRCLKGHLDFDTIFEFYKSISIYSNRNISLRRKIDQAREYINLRHDPCKCEWVFERHGWDSHWIHIDPRERHLWTKPCPYEIALQDLDDVWGPPDRERRGYFKVRANWLDISRKMFDANLIKYTESAKISPEGYLYADANCWHACEWNDQSPLTDLVDQVAEFEVEAMLRALTEWLDDVDVGAMPGWREDPVDFLRLSDTRVGLRLTQWLRLDEGH